MNTQTETATTTATATATSSAFAAGSAFDAALAARGWRADIVRYLGGFGPGWYVALRDAAGRRLAEGEGDTEAEAQAAALAAATGLAPAAARVAAGFPVPLAA
jgi:hypothetical protein